MNNSAPAYQHYARDWLVGTVRLTLEEQGALQRLLDHQWIAGPLDPDPQELARLVGMTPRKFAPLWKRLARHFPPSSNGHSGRLANERLEEQRAEQVAYREQQRLAGLLGSSKRWPKGRHTGGTESP